MLLIETDEYVDAAKAAEMLQIKRARMSQLCSDGRFPGMVRVGHFWLIPRKSVEEYERGTPGKKKKGVIEE